MNSFRIIISLQFLNNFDADFNFDFPIPCPFYLVVTLTLVANIPLSLLSVSLQTEPEINNFVLKTQMDKVGVNEALVGQHKPKLQFQTISEKLWLIITCR